MTWRAIRKSMQNLIDKHPVKDKYCLLKKWLSIKEMVMFPQREYS